MTKHGKRRDKMVIFKFDLSHKKTKHGIVLHLLHKPKPKTGDVDFFLTVAIFERFSLERETSL